jgi:hypothetical protein
MDVTIFCKKGAEIGGRTTLGESDRSFPDLDTDPGADPTTLEFTVTTPAL